jgi:hypothetical protein
MFNIIQKLLDNRSEMEKTIDKPVTESAVTDGQDGLLNRRALPALIVENFHKRRALLHNIRYSTVCLENRLETTAPELAADMNTYDWTGHFDGPNSPDFLVDVCRMATTDWSKTAPLGVKKDWTFGGDFKPGFYAIGTTNDCIDAMFNESPIDRKDVEPVVVDFLDELDQASLTFCTQYAREEAVNINHAFQSEARMY